MDVKNIAAIIDHTALKPETNSKQIEKLCAEAKEYSFASVCVNPCYVPLAKQLLLGSTVKVCTVIGFPLGANTSKVKALEAEDAIQNGAEEVDMVVNNGLVKSKDWDGVFEDIKAVVDAAKGKALVKVIFETCLLDDEEKKKLCELSVKAGADFVKTSTGFGSGGATAHDISLMRQAVGPHIGVKASGGVRTYETAVEMMEHGATRLGTSSSLDIIGKTSSSKGSY